MSIITVAEVKALVSDLNSDGYTAAITTQIPIVEADIVRITNNHFTRYEDGYKDDYTYTSCQDLTFAVAGKTITDNNSEVNFSTDHSFAAGDNLYIQGTRKNDGHYTVSLLTDEVITVTETLIAETTSENYTVWMFLVIWPLPLKNLAAQMIGYNILRKYNTDKNIKSEKIGDYAVSFGNGGTSKSYPDEIMSQLDEWTITKCL